jgi:hypothetical protein
MSAVKTKVKEKPILFTEEMIRAILEGKKTQTRRLVKRPLPEDLILDNQGFSTFTPKSYYSIRGVSKSYGGYGEWFLKLKYQKADTLYVKETYHPYGWMDAMKEPGNRLTQDVEYRATTEYNPFDMKWKPSLFMPKKYARIFLKVTGLRVERLQDISEEDCLKEGIRRATKDDNLYKFGLPSLAWTDWKLTGKEAYSLLWDSINSKKVGCLWEENPFCWVINFEVLEIKK